MRRPGFALVLCHPQTRTVELIKKGAVHNKSGVNQKKPHGQVLSEIAETMGQFLYEVDNGIVVREHAFAKFITETQALFKVIGVYDMLLWAAHKEVSQEISVQEVKLRIGGRARADKGEVMDGLVPYIGEQSYSCDDESDAVAVAIAWLISQDYIDSKLPVDEGEAKNNENDLGVSE